MPTTTIHSNGSKWMGESPDSLAKLLDMLAQHPLDPRFETYGNFILPPEAPAHEAMTRFWGNFATYSYVFEIDTDDPAVIDELTHAIRHNQQREDYQALKALL